MRSFRKIALLHAWNKRVNVMWEQNEVHFKFAIAWNNVCYCMHALVSGYDILLLEFMWKMWEEKVN